MSYEFLNFKKIWLNWRNKVQYVKSIKFKKCIKILVMQTTVWVCFLWRWNPKRQLLTQSVERPHVRFIPKARKDSVHELSWIWGFYHCVKAQTCQTLIYHVLKWHKRLIISLYKKKAQKFFLYYTSIPVLWLSTSVHCEKKN